MENNRQQELKQLLLKHYGEIFDTALTAVPGAFVKHGENVLQSIEGYFSEYTGPLESEPFIQWAEDTARHAVGRLTAFYALYEQYDLFVLDGVWSVLRGSTDLADSDDLGCTARDLAFGVWLWVFSHLTPSPATGLYELPTADGDAPTAEMSTRLYAKARWAARAWKTARLRDRTKHVDLDSYLKERTANMANSKLRVPVS